jgi:hypothetical protein
MTDSVLEAVLFAAFGTKQGHRRHVEPDWAEINRELSVADTPPQEPAPIAGSMMNSRNTSRYAQLGQVGWRKSHSAPQPVHGIGKPDRQGLDWCRIA